ncbi:MAG: glycoside-pentoside-hexuronide (GPH):cation symporter [Bacillota bacterium]|nr:glycoside-pentoside-hexuronide (GPH):cation symporter [Bacillota bacterium]
MKNRKENKSISGIGWKDKFGYGMGEVASGVTFGLVQSVLQKYYTDILGIGVISVMLLFVLARFWDAANDTICGHIVARLKPDESGRYRRWFKWFAVPLAASTVLMFVKLPGLSSTAYFIYACVTYVLFGMIYTCLNVPYGSLAQAITIDSNERASLSVARSVGGVFGAIPALILISFCYTTNADGSKQMSYPIIIGGVVAISLLSLVCYVILYRGTRERNITHYEDKAGQKGIFGRSVKALLTNKAFMVAACIAMLYLASQQFSMSYSTYLFQYYFDAPGLTMLPTVFAYLPVAVMMFCATRLGNKYGRRELCSYGLLVAGLGNFILYFIHTDNVWLYIAVLLLSGIGTTFIYLLIWSIASDAIDHVYLKSGVEEAYAYSFFSFMRKLGHCVAAVCVNMALWKIGYEGNVLNAANITDSTLVEMYTYSVLVPALLYFATFILLRFVYPLGKQAVEQQQKEKEAKSRG